jgi:hypothetical protein
MLQMPSAFDLLKAVTIISTSPSPFPTSQECLWTDLDREKADRDVKASPEAETIIGSKTTRSWGSHEAQKSSTAFFWSTYRVPMPFVLRLLQLSE